MSSSPAERGVSAAQLNRQLCARLAEVVTLDSLRQLSAATPLSSLFVPTVSDSYLRSATRLMIVGRETAGWGRGLSTDLAHGGRTANIETYLEHQMRHHQRKVVEVSVRSKFFQFYREAARAVAAPEDHARKDAPVWANLFCFDSAGPRPGRPDRQSDPKLSAAIVKLSLTLLRVQIAVLQPRMIIFTTGTSCDQYLHNLRDEFGYRLESTKLLPRKLWQFHLPIAAHGETCASGPMQTVAFRTPHPRHCATSTMRSAVVADLRTPGSLASYLRAIRNGSYGGIN